MADGNAPARRKPVRVSRDGARREIAAAEDAYAHSTMILRTCGTCGRRGLDVMEGLRGAPPRCHTPSKCYPQTGRERVESLRVRAWDAVTEYERAKRELGL